MVYDFNQIDDPKRFQRLLNAILSARFGEDARMTPLHGTDGASDGETAPDNPYMYFDYKTPTSSENPLFSSPRPGRYMFQAKYHRTGEQRPSDLRALVVREFKHELETAVLNRSDRRDMNYFFLVTNLSSSKQAIEKIDTARKNLLSRQRDRRLHADVWWSEQITAFLDWSPELWLSYPELFPGRMSPRIVLTTVSQPSDTATRTFRLAVSSQYNRDKTVKFRQIELEQKLLDLFVDLDVEPRPDPEVQLNYSVSPSLHHDLLTRGTTNLSPLGASQLSDASPTALGLLINDELSIGRILLEGGPGQGKSTITQMAAQVYREKLLGYSHCSSRDIAWAQMSKLRLPFRVELRRFAEWLSDHCDGTIDQYISATISDDSGRAAFEVRDLHDLVENGSVLLMLDGLDEIGSDRLRDGVIASIMDVIRRFEDDLGVDLRVVLTTRPPALAGRRDKLADFYRVVVAQMSPSRIDDYLNRWLTVQAPATDDRRRIEDSFNARRDEPHVHALARNPMQLSVLLQFIYLKGEAFPDHRAQLYRDYFGIVIDRDVEKSPELRDNREVVEGLHSFLGLYFHGTAEVDQRRRELSRAEIIRLAGQWLESDGYSSEVASRFFALGEERFGLVVALSGEGESTTYGFEVQPIQEYFAAAYISNRLAAGRAHDIFGLLLHRSYWREVALFLAGLRRPNEKADLVVRAKATDGGEMECRRQDGRSIVLQLLREGVFHNPRHVMLDAIDFVSDLLDMTELRARRTPEDFVDALCDIGERLSGDRLIMKVDKIAQRLSQSDDFYAVVLVQQVAARLLPHDQYVRILAGYNGKCPLLRSSVLMSIPYAAGRESTIRKLVAVSGYWDGVPVSVWARSVWQVAMDRRLVIDLEYPSDMHSWLVVEFATDHSRRYGTTSIEVESSRPFAIWKLYQNMVLLADYLTKLIEQRELRSEPTVVLESAVRPSSDNLNYDKLSPEVANTIRDLIEATDGLLVSVTHREGDSIGELLERYVSVVKDCAKRIGVAGWVAARCAIYLLSVPPNGLVGLVRGDVMDDLFSIFRELVVVDDISSRPYRYRYYADMPTKVRLTRGADPISLHRIIGDSFCRGEEGLPITVRQWMHYGSLPMILIRPLVERCRANIVELLRFVSERRVVGFTDRRLRVRDTRMVLRTCRDTDDEAVLRGAAAVLVNATFGRIVKPELLVKIIAAEPMGKLSSRVFGNTGDFVKSGLNDSDIAIAKSASEIILRDPDRYPSSIVVQAATFRADEENSAIMPLLDECPSLVKPESQTQVRC